MGSAIGLNEANIEFAEKSEEKKLRLRCLELSMESIRRTNEHLARTLKHSDVPSVQFVDENAWVTAADTLFQYIKTGEKIQAKH